LGVRGKNGKADALKAWARLLAGGPVHPAGEAATPALPPKTATEIIDAFLADAGERVRPITLKTYRRYLIPFKARYGDIRAADVTAALAEGFARRPTWGTTTRHNCLVSLATAFRWAGLPFRGLRVPPKLSRGAECVIPRADIERVLAATDDHFGPLVRFLWLTGCRPSEAMRVTAADLDDRAAAVRLTDHKTSHKGKPRVIHLTDEALAILTARRDRHPDGPLFRNSRGAPWRLNAVVNRLWRLNRKLGTKVTSYAGRHTFATDLLAAGVPDAHVAELLGHVGTGMLAKHYSHLNSRARVLKESLGRVRGVSPAP
jgi:integrase